MDVNQPTSNTPKRIGKTFFTCFPKAPKPTTVNIPPITGPFNSPLTINTKVVVSTPNKAIFIKVSPNPWRSIKSGPPLPSSFKKLEYPENEPPLR